MYFFLNFLILYFIYYIFCGGSGMVPGFADIHLHGNVTNTGSKLPKELQLTFENNYLNRST